MHAALQSEKLLHQIPDTDLSIPEQNNLSFLYAKALRKLLVLTCVDLQGKPLSRSTGQGAVHVCEVVTPQLCEKCTDHSRLLLPAALLPI